MAECKLSVGKGLWQHTQNWGTVPKCHYDHGVGKERQAGANCLSDRRFSPSRHDYLSVPFYPMTTHRLALFALSGHRSQMRYEQFLPFHTLHRKSRNTSDSIGVRTHSGGLRRSKAGDGGKVVSGSMRQ